MERHTLTGADGNAAEGDGKAVHGPTAGSHEAPAPGARAPEDESLRKMESIVAIVLRGGVFTSAAVVLIGTLMTLLDHHTYNYSVRALHGITAGRLKLHGAPYPHSLSSVFSGVASLNGPAVIMLGALILIATPVLRVAVSLITFAHQRNRDFVIITAIVLTILTTSFLLGKASGG